MIPRKDIQSFIEGIDSILIKLKIETFDLMLPILSMPKEFTEFHGEGREMLITIRENLITHSNVFAMELGELREELNTGSFTQKDIDELERNLNEGEARKDFVKSLEDMEEVVSLLKSKYGEKSERIYQEHKRSKRSDA